MKHVKAASKARRVELPAAANVFNIIGAYFALVNYIRKTGTPGFEEG